MVEVVVNLGDSLLGCLFHRLEITSIYPDGQKSSPLSKTFKTSTNGNIASLAEGEIEIATSQGGSRVLRWASRCTEGYSVSYDRLPQGSEEAIVAKMGRVEEKESRGFYEQQLVNLKPCSLYRWEIVGEPAGVSLASGTVDGPPRSEDWQFQMDDLKIEQREKEVSVLWTITQTCIEDYRITLCPLHHQGSENACWVGNFSRPNLKNKDDFLVKIQLTNLNDFDFHFDDCKEYEISIQPNVEGQLLETQVKRPFKYITAPKPPGGLSVEEAGETSANLSWNPEACSRGVLLHIVKDKQSVEKVLLDHGTTSYSVEGLHPCNDYQAWLIGMVESKESAPGPMTLFSTECLPGLEANVKDLKEDSFTLVLDEEGKVEMSCEDEEGRMFNRTEWGTDFVFNQLQPLTEYNCSGWISPKRGLKLRVETILVTTLAERPGPIFGFEATEVSKDGILLSWLPGSREVEEYCLTITSECTNWKIPECENTARRIGRGVDDEYYNTVEDGEVMRLLEVSDDDTELMGDYMIGDEKMGDNDMEKDKEDTVLLNGDCKAVEIITVLPPLTSHRLAALPGQEFSITIAAKSSNPTFGPESNPILAATLSGPPMPPEITEVTATDSGSLLVSFSTSCPLTGPTSFSLVWSCEDINCQTSASRAGSLEMRGPRLFEVIGLPGDTLFSVQVVVSLDDCKMSNEQNDCVARSKAETVSTQCGHQCADGTR